MEDNLESIIFEIIAISGDARSKACEAIAYAKDGKIELAQIEIAEARNAIVPAHRIQTDLIVDECSGKRTEVSMLFVHAQDHLMTSMMFIDIADDFVELYRRLNL